MSKIVEITNKAGWFDSMAFPAKARAKKTTRYSIERLLVNADSIVATDGKRLHITHSKHPLEIGQYNVVKQTKTKISLLKCEDELNWPKYNDVIPHHQNLIIKCGSYLEHTFIGQILGSLGKHNITLNYNFLKPLFELDDHWHIYYGSPKQPVRFVSEYNRYAKRWFEAVLMPTNAELDNIRHLTKTECKRKTA